MRWMGVVGIGWAAWMGSLSGCGGPDGSDGGTLDAPPFDVASDDSPSMDAPEADVGPCAGCDDGVDCTVDRCEGTTCTHVNAHGRCSGGQFCDGTLGCVAGSACASVTDCMRPDACVTVTCNAASARCEYAVLDGDVDGDPPLVCGGGDCDDSDATRSSLTVERCDTFDQDCDTLIDEGSAEATACGDQSTCDEGGCHCPRELDWCFFGVPTDDGYACVDVRSSPYACGRCGLACPVGVACVDGRCDCPAGQTSCVGGSSCVDLAADAENCGGCGVVCPAGVACTAGRCACAAGTSACDGSCVDFATDEANCGSCGNACPSGVTCTAGTCPCAGGASCLIGLVFLECGDLSTSAGFTGSYCGNCGNSCYGTGASCSGGRCVCPAGADRCDTVDAGSGRSSTTCTEFDTDPANCGACGRSCEPGIACTGGVCTGCAPRFTECDDVRGGPLCVDLAVNRAHCGSCNRSCGGSTPICRDGACRSF